jgi:F-type H+-transporting ATPase subunit b
MNINATLLVQALSFAALIWFTVKFVWPMITVAMDERTKRIADGLAAAEAGKQSLERSAKQAEEAIAQARSRANDIVAQAEKRAGQLIEEAKASARAEGDRLLAGAKAEIEQEAHRAREALRTQVAQLAVAGAEQILRREVDAKAHGELIAAIQKQL